MVTKPDESTRTEPERPDPPPERPDPSECCGGGCSPCIMDVYEDELARWRERQERARAQDQERKPEA